MRGLMPAAWRRRISAAALVLRIEQPDNPQLVVLEDEEVAYRLPLATVPPPQLREQLMQMARDAGHTLLQLDARHLLHKVLSLPAATESRLDSVLGFEMDRHTPFSADDVYFGYRVARRDAANQRILVDLYLMPRQRLDTLLQQLQPFGIAPTAVFPLEAQAASGHERQTLNLLPREQRSSAGHERQRSLRNRLLVAAVLLALLAGFPLYERSQQVARLEAALEQPRAQAQRAQQVRADIDALVEGRQFLGRKKAAQTPALFILDELTRLLPDNTWLSRLELNDPVLRIQGESGSASSLIGLLEASDLLMAVDFTSPVTINPRSRRERFSIEARLESGPTDASASEVAP
ncbi:PilN domain-containing protein [Marinobacterium rhizophilum]|uniref:PilN domain-containing protein n=1 Tax=Marinobacterium rhizophilum TaxID=420402 RepID=A0ABY5HLP2_9GAMM|nr:PilN domain-containing protein [Marinobacterium rhizophilum]UTW12184.1 PilN domain-containing protein [Marinobacterium rhizophilum]